MQTKHEKEILRIKSKMNEEHKREIIAKEDQITTLQSQNHKLQLEIEQNTVNDRSNTLLFVLNSFSSLLALDNGKEKCVQS